MRELGNIAEDAVLDFTWDSNDAAGASVTRATNGTISVYKGNNTTQSTAGVTDTEDFDSLTGVHHVRIDTSADAFYAPGNDYHVVLSGATIDGQTVNATLARFSIENRRDESAIDRILLALPNVAHSSAGGLVTSGTGTGQIKLTSGKVDVDAAGLDAVLIDGVELPNAMEIMAAAVAGKSTQDPDGTEHYIGLDGSTERLEVTFGADDMRATATYNP